MAAAGFDEGVKDRGAFPRFGIADEPSFIHAPHPTAIASAEWRCGWDANLVENCRRLGINPRDYFEDVLTRLPGMKASEAASPTPANWLKVRSGKIVRTAA